MQAILSTGLRILEFVLLIGVLSLLTRAWSFLDGQTWEDRS